MGFKAQNQPGSSKRCFVYTLFTSNNRILALWILLLVFVSGCLHTYIATDAKNRRKESLVSVCEQKALIVQDQFTVIVNHVHTLANWVSALHDNASPSAIDQVSFAEYFVPFRGPFSYLTASDMMTGAEDRENILRARAKGKAVFTIPVYKYKLPSNPTMEQRIQATAWYLGGSFNAPLVDSLLAQLDGNKDITVNVYDVTNSSDSGRYQGGGKLVHVSKLDLGDPFRKHQMTCRYLLHAPPTEWAAIVLPFGVFVIELLVGYILYSAVRQVVQAEATFHELVELKAKAEAADAAKSQFLAAFLHKIRTPLNGIHGALALLLDTELSSAQRNYAQTAQGLIGLINKELDRAKTEAGKVDLNSVAVMISGDK